jgi:hypothetical protein
MSARSKLRSARALSSFFVDDFADRRQPMRAEPARCGNDGATRLHAPKKISSRRNELSAAMGDNLAGGSVPDPDEDKEGAEDVPGAHFV